MQQNYQQVVEISFLFLRVQTLAAVPQQRVNSESPISGAIQQLTIQPLIIFTNNTGKPNEKIMSDTHLTRFFL